jgi:tetratricopeptide (TPR) repeat protein
MNLVPSWLKKKHSPNDEAVLTGLHAAKKLVGGNEQYLKIGTTRVIPAPISIGTDFTDFDNLGDWPEQGHQRGLQTLADARVEANTVLDELDKSTIRGAIREAIASNNSQTYVNLERTLTQAVETGQREITAYPGLAASAEMLSRKAAADNAPQAVVDYINTIKHQVLEAEGRRMPLKATVKNGLEAILKGDTPDVLMKVASVLDSAGDNALSQQAADAVDKALKLYARPRTEDYIVAGLISDKAGRTDKSIEYYHAAKDSLSGKRSIAENQAYLLEKLAGAYAKKAEALPVYPKKPIRDEIKHAGELMQDITKSDEGLNIFWNANPTPYEKLYIAPRLQDAGRNTDANSLLNPLMQDNDFETSGIACNLSGIGYALIFQDMVKNKHHERQGLKEYVAETAERTLRQATRLLPIKQNAAALSIHYRNMATSN